MSAERCSRSRVCAGLHSAPVRRSFDKEMGATRALEVIFSPCCGMCQRRPRISGVAYLYGGDRSRSLGKNELKQAKKFAHLRPGNIERRQQAQSKVMGAIDQQASAGGLRDERSSVDGELDTDHQPL